MSRGQIEWDLKPGDVIRRVELHDRFGGSRYGGISPSGVRRNALVFSDPERAAQNANFDNGQADGLFHKTGEGQKGDQRMEGGNKASSFIMRRVGRCGCSVAPVAT